MASIDTLMDGKTAGRVKLTATACEDSWYLIPFYVDNRGVW